jgi:hypothetical protein
MRGFRIGKIFGIAIHDVRQLPVLRNGNLAGLLRRRDIIQWLQLQSEGVS